MAGSVRLWRIYLSFLFCCLLPMLPYVLSQKKTNHHGEESAQFIDKHLPWLHHHVANLAQPKLELDKTSGGDGESGGGAKRRNLLEFLLDGYPGVNPYVQDLLRNGAPTEGILPQVVQDRVYELLKSGEVVDLVKQHLHQGATQTEGIKDEHRRYKRAPQPPQPPNPTIETPNIWDSDANMDPNCEADMDTYLRPITSMFLYVVSLVLHDQNITAFPAILPIPDIHDYITSFPGWGLKMYDSNFKLPTGFLQGNLYWIGSQEECNGISVTYNFTNNAGDIIPRAFDGNYCRVNLVTGLTNGTYWPLQLGICFPDSCNEGNITEYFTSDNLVTMILFKFLQLEIPNIYCGQEVDITEDQSAQAALIICGIFLVLIILATTYDGYFRHKMIHRRLWTLQDSYAEYHYPEQSDDENVDLTLDSVHNYLHGEPSFGDRMEVVVAGFSMYTNLRDIFHPLPEQNRKYDPVIDGLRGFTYVYFILGMTWVIGPLVHVIWTTSNLLDALTTFPQEFAFQIILNAYTANYTFMFLCGYLATQWWFKVKKQWENGFTPFQLCRTTFWFIFRKYWSLMPAIMMSLMILTTTYRYLGYGATFPNYLPGINNCYTYWWQEIGFVLNFIDFSYQCMGWLFYISVIYQVYVSSVLILVPLVVHPISGYVMLVIFYIANILCLAAMCGKAYDGELSFIKDILGRPWSTCGPYLFGIAMAIMHHEGVFSKARVSKVVNLLMWLITVALLMSVTFSTYTATKAGGIMAGQWSRAEYVAYFTLSPTAWSLALCWVLASCHMDCAGCVRDLLSWGGMRVVARLSFPSLILWAAILSLYFYQQFSLVYISRLNMNYLFFGQFFITLAVGLITTLLWERPLSRGPLFACECRTRLEALRYGRYPLVLEEQIRSSSSPKAKDMVNNGKSNHYLKSSVNIVSDHYGAVSMDDTHF